jgi:hypothetical protein
VTMQRLVCLLPGGRQQLFIAGETSFILLFDASGAYRHMARMQR